MALVVRSEVLEYGSSLAPWLGRLDSLPAIKAAIDELHQLASFTDEGKSFVTPQAIATSLDITPVQTKILLDLLASVVEPADLVQRADGGDGILGVELYSLALYLFVHFYLREAARAETADVWPSEYAAWQQEPSSPMRMTARSWGRDASPSHKAHLPLMRQHLQQHLQLQEALVLGFGSFVARHAAALLSLVLTPPAPTSPGRGGASLRAVAASSGPPGMVSAAELDRLGFLLQPAEEVGLAGLASRPQRPSIEGGSPMDVCTSTPFSASAVPRLSEATPFFAAGGAPTAQYAPLEAVAAWLADQLRPMDDSSDMMLGTSPPRNSVFNRLVQVSSLACPSDIHGASRSTVVRGEDDFPSGRLRVLDCHDTVIYALAPLQYCLLTACSDCVVVLGAVGRVLRVERCERVQVIAAARCVTINTCHDCILYLGVNQQPLVLGDNRFVQLAPYSSGYERLGEHMALAGVRPCPNLWDQPLALLPDHSKHHHGSMQNHGGHGGHAHPGHGSPAGSSPLAGGLGSAGGQPGSPAESMQMSQQQQQQQQPSPSPGPTSGLAALTPGSPAAAGLPGEPSPSPSPSAASPLAVAVGSPVPGTPAAVTLLPPPKLVPFFIPFRGGAGPMCGGPARPSAAAAPSASPAARPAAAAAAAAAAAPAAGAGEDASTSAAGAAAPSGDNLSSLFGGGEGGQGSCFPASPFALPEAYRAAWEERTRGALEIKAAVKAANLDEGKKRELMAAIQGHFKDWLQSSGSMRQIYDLAKLERDESSSQLMNTL